MEGKAAAADEEVAEEGEVEDARVGVVVAVEEAADAEVEEGDVGEGVDDFGRVGGGVVVLVGDFVSDEGGQGCYEEVV